MAVSNPQSPNLADSYSLIQRALEKQAEVASQRPPSTLGNVAKVAGVGVGAYAGAKVANKLSSEHDKDLLLFKNNLEKQLEDYKNRSQEGPERNQAEVDKYWTDITGDVKHAPKLPGGKIRATDEKLQNFLHTAEASVQVEKMASQYDESDPKRAAAYRALLYKPEEAAKLEIGSDTPFGKMDVIEDKTSSTGFSYITRTKAGEIVKTGLPAPKEAMQGRQSPMLDPRRRKEELRKEFDTRVDKVGFENVQKAYQIATNSEKNKSISNDMSLIYAVAQAREPQSRLTDQDFDKAAEAGSLSEDLQKHYNKVKGGQILVDTVRKSLVDSVEQSFKYSEEQLVNYNDEYKKIAKDEGLPDINFAERRKIDIGRIKRVRDKQTGEIIEAVVYPDGRIVPLKKNAGKK